MIEYAPISLKVDSNYCPDLHDDFVMNYDYDLYEFTEDDPVRAFYLGVHIQEWFPELEKEQKYLYSKQLRHIKDNLDTEQIEYWIHKFSDSEEIELAEMSEYVINNMFYTEEIDRINLALFFGDLVARQKKDEESNDIH